MSADNIVNVKRKPDGWYYNIQSVSDEYTDNTPTPFGPFETIDQIVEEVNSTIGQPEYGYWIS